ncbi:hypothetical protein [Paragemmobacter aquarius]|uniref:hypothetical protein n=1 Tax=Paragemmobacter aquarius TaxID=2169400 RepID=UPI001C1FA7D5|nr:hypothetical protein [Gemmobacter aquarius]
MDDLATDVEAFTKAPDAPRPDPAEHEGCEVKGSGTYNPCLKGGKLPASTDKAAKALAIPFPSDCRYHPYEVEQRHYSRAELDAYDRRTSPTEKACKAYMASIEGLFTNRDDIPPEVLTKFDTAHTITVSLLATYASMAMAAPPPQSRPTPEPAPIASGSGSCSNPFGGRAATHGEYICSDQGELQACQCSGGSCEIVLTGWIACTQPGAVVR